MAEQGGTRKVARAEVFQTLKDGYAANDAVRIDGMEGLLRFREKKAKLRAREEKRLIGKYGEKATRLERLHRKQAADLDLVRGLKIELGRAKAGTKKTAKNEWAVRGHVYDRDATPVAGARIALLHLDGERVRKVPETRTDARGAYELRYKAKPADIVKEREAAAKPLRAKAAKGNKAPADADRQPGPAAQREKAAVFLRASFGKTGEFHADSTPVLPRPGVSDYRDILFGAEIADGGKIRKGKNRPPR